MNDIFDNNGVIEENNDVVHENQEYNINNEYVPTYEYSAEAPSPVPSPVQEPKPKKSRLGLKITALGLCCAIIGGAMGVGGVFLGSNLKKGNLPSSGNVSTIIEGVRESSVIDIAHVDTGKEMTPAEVYAANVNSTVGITTSITTNYWGYQTTSAASGSGFIISDDGYIITNYHVIEGSNSITVSMYNGESYNAALIGYDASNDLAILKIDAEGLSPVIIGDSSNMNVGDGVVAIGNPLGELTFSLTTGVVSALEREVTLSSNVTMNLIQTDCAINSGNSGGALFNLYGEVIGITNAKYSSSGYSSSASIDNIGFAIPMNDVKGIIQSIIEKGYITKPYIGVSISNVSEESQSYGLPQGAAVKVVVEDGPASKGGLMENDIITSANGKTVTGSSDLVSVIEECQPGDELKVTVYRQGQTVELTITVGEQTKSALADESSTNQSQSQQGGMFGFPWGNFGN